MTVLDTDGHLLASGDDLADAAPGQKLSLENAVSKDIQDNIRQTLTPFLGLRNFQISVATQAEYRQEADEGDDLQSQFARRAVGSRRQAEPDLAEFEQSDADER